MPESTSSQVIDLMAARLRRQAEQADTALEFEVTTMLHRLYLQGRVEAGMREGVIIFRPAGDGAQLELPLREPSGATEAPLT